MRRVPSGGGPDGRGPGDRAIADYQALCRSGEPSLDRFWAGLGARGSLTTLAGLIKLDLEWRFDRGQRPRAADYLGRFPELAGSGDRVVSLIYEEFCLLAEHGEDPDSALFCELYGPWRDSLRSQLAYHRELSRAVGIESPPTKYPKPGDRFAKYNLRSLLGVGGTARVFLATEDELGGRKVALKVSASVGREPTIMANLDHRNIVPVLSVTDPVEGLRGFCMPYRPGVTLEELIRRVARGDLPREARAVREALRPGGEDPVEAPGEDRPGWADFPERGTYPEAVAWIGLALANALAYLHGREVLHRDIKPANVLLAYREGPQLLDFNLAHAPSAAEHAQAALKGGTLPYMAPEQLKAFLDRAEWGRVGAPADLYSLGLVLRVLLTGRLPDLPDPGLPLTRAIGDLLDRRAEPLVPIRRFNPGVPPSLESIVGRCLGFRPEDRYAGASDLAEDLRLFLDRRPLKHAENPSIVERASNLAARNWRRAGVAALLGAALWFGTSSPTPVPDLREFRQAVARLDSGDPANWARARDSFGRLARAHPGSAWPQLYLGLALEKIALGPGGDGNLAAANEPWKKAEGLPDYEEALGKRLGEDPTSATVRVAEGRWIQERSDDPGRFARSYPGLKIAIKSDPGRVHALEMLANAERRMGKLEDSILHFGRAIEIGAARPSIPPGRVNNWRLARLSALDSYADRQLGPDGVADGRREAAATLRRIEQGWEDLDRAWALGPPGSPSLRDCLRRLYRGSVASGRAVLAAEDGRPDQAGRGFEEARRAFEEAGRAVAGDASGADSYRKFIGLKLEELGARSRRFDRARVGDGPAAGPAN